jgi:Holliday junction resolvasome RuvABC DNA-binding subunit
MARKEAGVQEDAVSALVNLGYSVKSAKEAVDRASAGAKDITLESLIKKTLRVLA